MFQGPRLRDWQALLELLVDTTMPRTYQKARPEHTQSGNSFELSFCTLGVARPILCDSGLSLS